MSKHGYEGGRLDLPFVGVCTFGKRPMCLDWDNIDADVAVLGVPFDMGTQYRSGARFGPRAIREASTLFSFGHDGAYDHEDDQTYSDRVRIVDIGDADIVHIDTATSHANTDQAIRRSKQGRPSGGPGGDHAINIPCVRAFSEHGPIHMCRSTPISTLSTCATASEKAIIRCAVRLNRSMSAVPVRLASATSHRQLATATRTRQRGASILSVRQARKLGAEGVLASIRRGPATRNDRH